MSVSAAVQYTQGVTVGTAGQALFGVDGTSVVVGNGNNTNVNQWTFTVIDVPPTSAVPVGQVQSGLLSTWAFTPDVTGGYLVQVTVKNTVDGSTATDTRCFGVKEASGRFVPAFKATDVMLNFGGQSRGWATYMEVWFAYIDSLGSAITTADYPAQSSNKTIAQTSGWVYVGFITIGGGVTATLPSSPSTGMIVTVSAEDTSFHAANITIAATGGKQIQYGDGAAVSSYAMSWGVFGSGGSMTIRWNGLVWKYIA